jgi:hypothetical protein
MSLSPSVSTTVQKVPARLAIPPFAEVEFGFCADAGMNRPMAKVKKTEITMSLAGIFIAPPRRQTGH